MAKKIKAVKKFLSNEERRAKALEDGVERTPGLDLGLVQEMGEPTRTFFSGDRVSIGNLDDVIIEEQVVKGVYLVSYLVPKSRDYTPQPGERYYGFWTWWNIYPTGYEHTAPESDLPRINFSNRDVSGLLSMCTNRGLDFNPDFQRGYVWTSEDCDKLIESIFLGKDVGKFVMWNRPYPHRMVVVDGKQRLTTILNFYLGKISWKGKYFMDFDRLSRHRFKSCPVPMGELAEGTDYKDVLKVFLDINKGGVPQLDSHLDKVTKLLEDDYATY